MSSRQSDVLLEITIFDARQYNYAYLTLTYSDGVFKDWYRIIRLAKHDMPPRS
jgi:hypothetical protein